MARRPMYSFEEKKHSFNGIISTIMGLVGFCTLIGMIYASYYNRGHAGIYAGAFGITGMVFSLAGFIIGIRSFSERNIKYKYPKLGSFLCGIAFVLWLGILAMGV